MTEGRQVVKTRYFVPLERRPDRRGRRVRRASSTGSSTGEVEFPDAETALAFDAPDWLGRDVTEDPRYANRTLAVEGIPD